MRVLILICFLVSSCLAQDSRQSDAKSVYEDAMNKLTGVPPNRSDLRGVDLMSRSADMGYLPAQVAVGTIYDTGMYIGANPSRASDFYRKAINQGSHFAEYLLGRMYYTGMLAGGKRDGEKWLLSAAEAGNPFAAYLLADSIYDRDPAGGIRWYRAAAEQGLPYAQYRLAKALLEGRVPPVNKREAYLWFSVAQDAGVNEAGTDRSLLESDLGTTETEKAKTEARDLRTKVRRASNPTRCKGWVGELDTLPTVPPLEILPYCD
jgi:hypothetical protein